MSEEIATTLRETIGRVPDFPKAGILFFDLTTVMRDPAVFRKITHSFAEHYASKDFDAIVGIDARGFIFGSCVAFELSKPFVPVRKPGKLPPEVERISYTLEYGEDVLEIRKDALEAGQKVVIIDDLLATGGTARGTVDLVRKVGAEPIECGFVVELTTLGAREKLSPVPVHSLVGFEE